MSTTPIKTPAALAREIVQEYPLGPLDGKLYGKYRAALQAAIERDRAQRERAAETLSSHVEITLIGAA